MIGSGKSRFPFLMCAVVLWMCEKCVGFTTEKWREKLHALILAERYHLNWKAREMMHYPNNVLSILHYPNNVLSITHFLDCKENYQRGSRVKHY